MTLSKGSRTCLWGPSGLGKTSLLRVIAGLDEPSKGEVRKPDIQRMAYQFQENRLLPWYTVAKNLELVLGRNANIPWWLHAVGLPEVGNMYPAELSGGMSRRISLLRALAYPSDLILLDEPLKEMDATTA